jgi:hypothetical protein
MECGDIMRTCERGACLKEAKWYKPGVQGGACCDEHKQVGHRSKLDRLKKQVERLEAEIAEREGSYRPIVKGA